MINLKFHSLTDGGEMEMMYEVTLCLSAMCLSINLCVLLVTSAQYFFAVTGIHINFITLLIYNILI